MSRAASALATSAPKGRGRSPRLPTPWVGSARAWRRRWAQHRSRLPDRYGEQRQGRLVGLDLEDPGLGADEPHRRRGRQP